MYDDIINLILNFHTKVLYMIFWMHEMQKLIDLIMEYVCNIMLKLAKMMTSYMDHIENWFDGGR